MRRGIRHSILQRMAANRRRYTEAPTRDLLEQQAIRALQEPAAPSPGTSTVPKYIQNRYGQNVINTHKTPVCEIRLAEMQAFLQ
jgi:hypothetical protein